MITNRMILEKLKSKTKSPEMYAFMKKCLELESEHKQFNRPYDKGITDIASMKAENGGDDK